jgi:hypothetical protein
MRGTGEKSLFLQQHLSNKSLLSPPWRCRGGFGNECVALPQTYFLSLQRPKKGTKKGRKIRCVFAPCLVATIRAKWADKNTLTRACALFFSERQAPLLRLVGNQPFPLALPAGFWGPRTPGKN